MRLYYAAEKEDVFSILEEGIKPSKDGVVYLSDDITACSIYARARRSKGIVIPVKIKRRDVYEIDNRDDGMDKVLYPYSDDESDYEERCDTTYGHDGHILPWHLPQKRTFSDILIVN